MSAEKATQGHGSGQDDADGKGEKNDAEKGAGTQEAEKQEAQKQEAETTRQRAALVRAIILAIGLALIVVILIDWKAIRFEGNRAGTDDAQLRGNPVRIEARVSGLVSRIGTDDDQPVHKGQLLYEIEQDTYQVDVAQNRALLQQTQAQVAELQARIAMQRAVIANAAATAQASSADAVRSQLELGRQTALRGTEGEIVRSYQQAAADARRDRLTVAANQDATRQTQVQVGILQAQLAQAQATAASQAARLDIANINLGYTRILAPADGTVTARLAYVGEFVVPGRPLLTFVPLNDIWVVANYREAQLTTMRPGQRAEFTVDTYPGVTFRGHVDSISPLAQSQSSALPPDRATGNFTKVVQRIPVKIVLDADQPVPGLLMPGLSVEARVFTDDPATP